MPNPPVQDWMVLVPPRFRPDKAMLKRLRTHMLQRFPENEFMVVEAGWNGDEITVIPCLGRVGGDEPSPMAENPGAAERRVVLQAALEFDPAASYAPN